MNNNRQPAAQTNRHPFGKSQIRLFQYILSNPGCTMAQIREDEFPDKNGNYVWNLVRENIYYIDKREIGPDLPDQLYLQMKRFKEAVDMNHYMRTGEIKMKLQQTAMSFPEQKKQ